MNDLDTVKVRRVWMTDEEYEHWCDSKRCEGCGHHDALHNLHCCEFCTIEGCGCFGGQMVEPREPTGPLTGVPQIGPPVRMEFVFAQGPAAKREGE